jgi:hypothetical protein
LGTLSSSHHDVPKYTDDARTVPTSCAFDQNVSNLFTNFTGEKWNLD